MLLELSAEQELFRGTTERFLEEHANVTSLRRLQHDPAGFGSDYWRRGVELGWTSLLVSEADGGAAISSSGLVDLTILAYEFGRHAAPGPLVSTNVVAGALSTAGGDKDLLAAMLNGTSIATWCFSEGAPHTGIGDMATRIAVEGGELVVDGVKRPVESADRATHFLVTGRTGDGLTQVIVPVGARGVSVVPMQGVDLTKRFSVVRFENARVPPANLLGDVAKAAGDVERQLHHALVIVVAEAVGAMQRAFDMTVAWAFDRYSFGRQLASYQALKHRFAQMATCLQASHAIADEAARAVAEGRPDAAEIVSSAKAYVGESGAELLQECVQLHGGIGVTFEHDLHLFLRRVTLARTLFGTPDAHRRRVADLVARKETAS
jgi:alkylation response protein AidB-like acyl-CoA dehydrogenase